MTYVAAYFLAGLLMVAATCWRQRDRGRHTPSRELMVAVACLGPAVAVLGIFAAAVSAIGFGLFVCAMLVVAMWKTFAAVDDDAPADPTVPDPLPEDPFDSAARAWRAEHGTHEED